MSRFQRSNSRLSHAAGRHRGKNVLLYRLPDEHTTSHKRSLVPGGVRATQHLLQLRIRRWVLLLSKGTQGHDNAQASEFQTPRKVSISFG